jgi:hypothetical protein
MASGFVASGYVRRWIASAEPRKNDIDIRNCDDLAQRKATNIVAAEIHAEPGAVLTSSSVITEEYPRDSAEPPVSLGERWRVLLHN